MKLFVVNGSDAGQNASKSWFLVAQNNVNLIQLLPADFEATEIIRVRDGLTGADRVLGYCNGPFKLAG